MAGALGSGGSGTVRGDGHAAWIGGVAGVGRSPVERQQSIERLDFGPADPADDVGQVGFRVDPVQPAGFCVGARMRQLPVRMMSDRRPALS